MRIKASRPSRSAPAGRTGCFVRVHTDAGHHRPRRRHAERLHPHHRGRRCASSSISSSARTRAASLRWQRRCWTASRSTAAISTAPRSPPSRSPAGTSSASRSACRSTSCSAAGCATACSATPMAGIAPSAAPEAFLGGGRSVIAKGFKAMKLDPFGTAHGLHRRGRARPRLRDPADAARKIAGRHAAADRRPCPLHRGGGDPRRRSGWRRSTSTGGRSRRRRDRQETVHAVARGSPIPVATGEMYDTVGQFFTLAAGGGVNIFQPEPMSLGGIGNTLAVANLALAHGSYHRAAPDRAARSRRPSACSWPPAVPNFLIQEHFDPFNEPWTRDLVTWHPGDRSGQRPSVAAGCAGPRPRARTRTVARRPSLRSRRLSRTCTPRAGRQRLGARAERLTMRRSGASCAFALDDLETDRDHRRRGRPRRFSRADQLLDGAAAHAIAVDPHRGQRRGRAAPRDRHRHSRRWRAGRERASSGGGIPGRRRWRACRSSRR